MSKAEILEQIAKLTPAERDEVRRKLDEFDHDLWDLELAADAEAGKLDHFVGEAIREYRAGKSRPYP